MRCCGLAWLLMTTLAECVHCTRVALIVDGDCTKRESWRCVWMAFYLVHALAGRDSCSISSDACYMCFLSTNAAKYCGYFELHYSHQSNISPKKDSIRSDCSPIFPHPSIAKQQLRLIITYSVRRCRPK
ncbi:hypothetical protein IWZ03DRAFT_36096 [Phyllosticta citriasiana]|uniref:Secreted protein n=1 Tax=Phyllosticta citriasiana TaxID=595635 RepID=A0ABR1L1B6_9PEZI